MKLINRQLLALLFGLMLVLSLYTVACKSEDNEEPEIEITPEVTLPAEIDSVVGGDVTFPGKGFMVGDHIRLVLSDDENTVYLIALKAITEQSITFTLPEEVDSGRYHIRMLRGEVSYELGAVTLNIHLDISAINIPSEVNVLACSDVTFTGKGFRMGDQIKMVLTTDENRVEIIDVKEVTEQSLTIFLHEDVRSGSYRLWVVRGHRTFMLGVTTLNIGLNLNIPDKPDMTVKGVVHSNGKGIAGVVVSDGRLVTVTGPNGIYYLASEKQEEYVFISVPGNYEVAYDQNAPQFFQRLSGHGVEQKDFLLTPVNNEDHVVMAIADLHLANRNNDLAQFQNFLTDINALINSYRTGGKKAYVLTLGDMSWEQFWYSSNFALPEYVTWMNRIDAPVFNVMGNHDNDGYRSGDRAAEQAYRDVIGPTFYSFNLGKIHYIVLDNISYINTGGAPGVMGSRNYSGVVTASQLQWLAKDLATLPDKSTPIVVAMHVQLYQRPNVNNSASISLTSGQILLNTLAGFTNVHFLTGHTHMNHTASSTAAFTEHNIAAVSATWWWTGRNGYANNHICKDGTPGGYGVFDFNGTQLSWYYKGIGEDRNYQFRSYDLNTAHITAAKYAPNANATFAARMPEFAGSYANVHTGNEVLINIWGYDPQWKVEVTENSVPLTVTRVSAMDPLHIISYEAKRLNANAEPGTSYLTPSTSNMFKVTASTPTSTLLIKVTDRFGNVYTETMTRPKELTCDMK